MYISDNKPELQDLAISIKPDLEVLAHHGVKGMKWGVRRTPEQLGHRRSSRKTVSGKSDNTSVGFGGVRLYKFATRKAFEAGNHISDKLEEGGNSEAAAATRSAVKKLNYIPIPDLNIGAEVAAGVTAALVMPINPVGGAALGGLAGVAMARRLKNAGRSIGRTASYKLERDAAPVDEKTGLRKKQKNLTSEEDSKRVNPMYGDALKGSKNNCMACSMAYDMRRRGYEVRAKKINFGLLNSDMQKYYKDSVYSGDMRPRHALDALKSEPDGSRGAVTVKWTMGGGHSMGYEVHNGEVTIIDSQSSKRYSEKAFRAKAVLGVTTMGYTRLDNCTPDIEALKRDIIE